MAFFFWNANSAPSRWLSWMNLWTGVLKMTGNAAEAFDSEEGDHVDFD